MRFEGGKKELMATPSCVTCSIKRIALLFVETVKIMGNNNFWGKHKTFFDMFTVVWLSYYQREISRRQWQYAYGIFIFSDQGQMGRN